MTNVQKSQVDKIRLLGKTPRELFQREDFRTRGYTLIEERTAYQKDPNFRRAAHTDAEKGIWTPEAIFTNGAKELPNGCRRYKWVREPSEEFVYNCPPSGYTVPATSGKFKGMLYHPEIGAAVATVGDRDEAVKLNEVYMKRHWDKQFGGWEISEGIVKLWGEDAFGEKFDPKNPTSRQLALFETSYQISPVPDTGIRPVLRSFWLRDRGPSIVGLDRGLSDKCIVAGVRLHK